MSRESSPEAKRMLFVMNAMRYPMYMGTVRLAVKRRRRAANRVAKASRKVNRNGNR